MSIEELPDLDLKKLPDHLEYMFLPEGAKLSVTISSNLSGDKKGRLVAPTIWGLIHLFVST